MEELQAEKNGLQEQIYHLQAEELKFSYYHDNAQREHEETKEKLVTSQANVAEHVGLRDQILKKLLLLKANKEQETHTEDQCHNDLENDIQELQNTVQASNTQKIQVENQVKELQTIVQILSNQITGLNNYASHQ